jgi:hypothetical protein
LVTVLGGLAAAGSLKIAQVATLGAEEVQVRIGAVRDVDRLPPV